jgi:hypothetical protein
VDGIRVTVIDEFDTFEDDLLQLCARAVVW